MWYQWAHDVSTTIVSLCSPVKECWTWVQLLIRHRVVNHFVCILPLSIPCNVELWTRAIILFFHFLFNQKLPIHVAWIRMLRFSGQFFLCYGGMALLRPLQQLQQHANQRGSIMIDAINLIQEVVVSVWSRACWFALIVWLASCDLGKNAWIPLLFNMLVCRQL